MDEATYLEEVKSLTSDIYYSDNIDEIANKIDDLYFMKEKYMGIRNGRKIIDGILTKASYPKDFKQFKVDNWSTEFESAADGEGLITTDIDISIGKFRMVYSSASITTPDGNFDFAITLYNNKKTTFRGGSGDINSKIITKLLTKIGIDNIKQYCKFIVDVLNSLDDKYNLGFIE